MKVALLEASHWHVPLYLDPLETTGIEVVAVSDAEQARGPAIAARFGSTLYSSSRDLLDREQFDFAFVFGRHSEMPSLAEALIARKTPFALEKPCGVSMSQVTRLRRLAEEANVYCAIPFIFRMSDLLAALRDAEGSIPANFNYMSFRFIVGSPERYKAAGAGWATDPVFSGGGSTINVATHFIDLFRLLTGKEIARVSATMHSRTHRGAVEDYSLLTMHTDGWGERARRDWIQLSKHCRRAAGIFVHHLIGSDVREVRSGSYRDSRPQQSRCRHAKFASAVGHRRLLSAVRQAGAYRMPHWGKADRLIARCRSDDAGDGCGVRIRSATRRPTGSGASSP